MNTPDSESPLYPSVISVIFINGYLRRRLCTAILPALPHPGDEVYLGTLAYQVTGHNWYLTPNGQIDIHVVLLPQVNESGERPFSYPEETRLAKTWGVPPTTSEANS